MAAMNARSLLFLLPLAGGWLLACDEDGDGDRANDSDGSDDGTTDITPVEACKTIIAACHEKDDGNNVPVSECHGMAHDGEYGTLEMADECLVRLDECVDTCESAPYPDGQDSGTSIDDSDY